MPHFATTALTRKRTAEKTFEKHHEKTSKIHAKSDENSWRFRKSMADSIFHAFWLILAHFLVKNVLWASPGDPGRLKGRPVAVRGGLGEAPGALREDILGEKVVFGNRAGV